MSIAGWRKIITKEFSLLRKKCILQLERQLRNLSSYYISQDEISLSQSQEVSNYSLLKW